MFGWTHISKARPPIGERVLTYSEHHGIQIRTYRKSAFKNKHGDFAEWTCYSYSPEYWMRLPEKPNKEER